MKHKRVAFFQNYRHLFKILIQALPMSRKASGSKVAPPAKKRHWMFGLLESMNDPNSIVQEDDKIVAIVDKYPKARFHYLVLPREDIPSLKNITKEHESLLEHMEKVGKDIAARHEDYTFIIGYHAVPSMHRLHLHVISTDFDSPCMKTRHHWNSFTTPFFMPSEDVIKQLKEEGELKKIDLMEHEDYVNADIQCHRCSYVPKSMPDLKRHIVQHAPKT